MSNGRIRNRRRNRRSSSNAKHTFRRHKIHPLHPIRSLRQRNQNKIRRPLQQHQQVNNSGNRRTSRRRQHHLTRHLHRTSSHTHRSTQRNRQRSIIGRHLRPQHTSTRHNITSQQQRHTRHHTNQSSSHKRHRRHRRRTTRSKHKPQRTRSISRHNRTRSTRRSQQRHHRIQSISLSRINRPIPKHRLLRVSQNNSPSKRHRRRRSRRRMRQPSSHSPRAHTFQPHIETINTNRRIPIRPYLRITTFHRHRHRIMLHRQNLNVRHHKFTQRPTLRRTVSTQYNRSQRVSRLPRRQQINRGHLTRINPSLHKGRTLSIFITRALSRSIILVRVPNRQILRSLTMQNHRSLYRLPKIAITLQISSKHLSHRQSLNVNLRRHTQSITRSNRRRRRRHRRHRPSHRSTVRTRPLFHNITTPNTHINSRRQPNLQHQKYTKSRQAQRIQKSVNRSCYSQCLHAVCDTGAFDPEIVAGDIDPETGTADISKLTGSLSPID